MSPVAPTIAKVAMIGCSFCLVLAVLNGLVRHRLAQFLGDGEVVVATNSRDHVFGDGFEGVGFQVARFGGLVFQRKQLVGKLGAPLVVAAFEGTLGLIGEFIDAPGEFGHFLRLFRWGKGQETRGIAVEPAEVAVKNGAYTPGDVAVKLTEVVFFCPLGRKRYGFNELVGGQARMALT